MLANLCTVAAYGLLSLSRIELNAHLQPNTPLDLAPVVKQVADGRVVATVDRTDLVVVQTPQGFAAEALRAAHRSGRDATDDAGLLEDAGLVVGTVPGDPRNLKLTRPEDLALAEALLDGATR